MIIVLNHVSKPCKADDGAWRYAPNAERDFEHYRARAPGSTLRWIKLATATGEAG